MSESTLARLRVQLNRGDTWLTYDLTRLLAKDGLDDTAIEELETRLLAADAGVEAAQFLGGHLRTRVRQGRIKNESELKAALKGALLELLAPCQSPLAIPEGIKPFILLVVGVNGVGKTTTIGKLALRLKQDGHSVLLAAGDTFRAAATDQLRVWAERAGAPLIAQGPGADSASVIHDAILAAQSRGVDVVIADTAGRLHTQSHLMDELRKIKRVIQKLDAAPSASAGGNSSFSMTPAAAAPHEILLVLDATTGGNALNQAQQFHQALGLTGLVLTKLDGTAKGGTLLALARRLALPIRYIGIGENVEDLLPFDAASFIEALIS